MGDLTSHQHTTPRHDLDFVDKSSLTYFIPRATDLAFEKILKDESLPFQQLLDSIGQRESLFFDESVYVVFVLRIPHIEDDSLRNALNSFIITLDTQITNGNVPDRDSSVSSEVINSTTVDASQDSAIIVRKTFNGGLDSSHDSEACTYAVWKKSVFLNRPRIRLQNPSVAFVATAGLRSVADSRPDEVYNGYMPSGVASSLNLLESFGSDSALNGVKPRLSALRVSRVAPLTHQASDHIRPIKSLSRLSLRIYPAVHSRIRFMHPNTAPATAAVLAMLEIDFTPFFDCEIILNTITLEIPEATVEDLTGQAGLSLPLSCVAHDHITFMYRIAPINTDVVSQSLMRDLDIEISATAMVNPTTKPRLRMSWTAAVDFTVPVNPGYGSTLQPIQRAHRPGQLSIGGESTISLTAPSIARPDALPSLETSTTQTEATVQELGVIVTFSAPSPPHKIFVGDEFVWSVFVVNQLQNKSAAARKLAMVVIPKRKRSESRVARLPSLSQVPEVLHRQSTSKTTQVGEVAEATLDDNVVHTMQCSSLLDDTELVCLSADVRIGPLVPGTCHAAELRFMAMKEGILGVEAVRIIDLGNNEHVDIKHLPTVTVEKGPETS